MLKVTARDRRNMDRRLRQRLPFYLLAMLVVALLGRLLLLGYAGSEIRPVVRDGETRFVVACNYRTLLGTEAIPVEPDAASAEALNKGACPRSEAEARRIAFQP